MIAPGMFGVAAAVFDGASDPVAVAALEAEMYALMAEIAAENGVSVDAVRVWLESGAAERQLAEMEGRR